MDRERLRPIPAYGVRQFAVGTGGASALTELRHDPADERGPAQATRSGLAAADAARDRATIRQFLPICRADLHRFGHGFRAYAAPRSAHWNVSRPSRCRPATGEKPQSKVWQHGGSVVGGAAVHDGGAAGGHVGLAPGATDDTWSERAAASRAATDRAGGREGPWGGSTHVLLHGAFIPSSVSVAVQVGRGNNTYEPWSSRACGDPGLALPGSEIGDDRSRLHRSDVVRDREGRTSSSYYSDTPYSSFSGPGHPRARTSPTMTSGSSRRCRTARSACSGRTRPPSASASGTHIDGELPRRGSADEVPASARRRTSGLGMADDHMNVAVAADGTSMPRSRRTTTPPAIRRAAAVRRPNGAWDPLYEVDSPGLAGSCCSNEEDHSVRVVYSSSEGYNDIVVRSSPTSAISFGPRTVVMPGGLNDVTSTKDNWTDQVLVLASSSTEAKAAFLTAGAGGNQAPVAVADAYSTAQETAKVVAAPVCSATTRDANSEPVDGGVGGGRGAWHAWRSTRTVASPIRRPAVTAVPDSFTYQANDGTANSNIVTVSLTVTMPRRASLRGSGGDEWSGATRTTARVSANQRSLLGSPTFVTGQVGQALSLNGTGQNASGARQQQPRPDHRRDDPRRLDPAVRLATQDLIKKATNGGTNGYELSGEPDQPCGQGLRPLQPGDLSGDTFRINSTTHPIRRTARLDACRRHLRRDHDQALRQRPCSRARSLVRAAIATNSAAARDRGPRAITPAGSRACSTTPASTARALSTSEIAALAWHHARTAAPNAPTLNSPAERRHRDRHLADAEHRRIGSGRQPMTVTYFGRPLASGNFAQIAQHTGVASGAQRHRDLVEPRRRSDLRVVCDRQRRHPHHVTGPTWTFHTTASADPVFVGAGDIAVVHRHRGHRYRQRHQRASTATSSPPATTSTTRDRGRIRELLRADAVGRPVGQESDAARPRQPRLGNTGTARTTSTATSATTARMRPTRSGKSYYSYDIAVAATGTSSTSTANAQLVPGGCAAGSPQELWLKADLAANSTQERDRDVAQAALQLGRDAVPGGAAAVGRSLCGGRRHPARRPRPHLRAHGADEVGCHSRVVRPSLIPTTGSRSSRSAPEARGITDW